MHCPHFSVQGSCLVFCDADEDTGKTRADTCNPRAFQIHFRDTIDRHHGNMNLLKKNSVKSDNANGR